MGELTAGGARREEILQVAQRLFAEQGFRETNLNDVAERLGFRRQALYHYFRSKDEILWVLIGRSGRALEQAVDEIFQSDLPPADKLAEIVRTHVRQVLTNIDIFRIQFSEVPKLTGDRADTHRKLIAGYVRRLATVIADGQRDGSFVDVPPRVQARLITGMCNWTVEWFSDDCHLTIDEVADHAARSAVSGVLARANPREAGSSFPRGSTASAKG